MLHTNDLRISSSNWCGSESIGGSAHLTRKKLKYTEISKIKENI